MRMLLKVTAGLAAAGCALYPATIASELTAPLVVGSIGLTGIVLALITDDWVLAGPGTGAIVIAYAIALSGSSGGFAWTAPGLAVACLLTLELVDLASLPPGSVSDRPVAAARLRHIALVFVLGGMAAAATATGALLIVGGATPLLLIAVASSGAALALLVSLAGRAIAR